MLTEKKYFNSKFEFNKSLFENQEFTIPLIPDCFGFKLLRNKFENKPEIIKKQVDWIKSCGYYKTEKEQDDVINKHHRKIASILYPDVNEKTFEFLVVIYEHGYVMDDFHFETGNFTNKMDNYLNGEDSKQEIFGKLYRNTINEYKNYGHPINFQRIYLENSKWTRGAINANVPGVYNVELTVEQYLEIRYLDAGGCVAAAYMMSLDDEFVSDEIYYSPLFAELQLSYEYFGCICNDIYSFKIEIDCSSFSNIVKLLAVLNGDIQKGIDQSFKLCIDYLVQFNHLLDKVSSLYPNDKSVQVYLKRYKYLAQGTYYLHFMADRYQNKINMVEC